MKMLPKLKVDLHTHTAEDLYENINYDAYQLIDRAGEKGFDALAITNHDRITYNKELVRYAEKRDILLIPGMEATFSNKHVLIINPGFKKNPLDRPLRDLEKIKSDKTLIIAPHPFFPSSKSLKSDLIAHPTFFDAIEYSHCYNHLINSNKKALLIAEQHKKPLVGTSDCHHLWQFGTTYTLIEAKKEILSIIEAVKRDKIELHTAPLSLFSMAKIAMNFILSKRSKAAHGP